MFAMFAMFASPMFAMFAVHKGGFTLILPRPNKCVFVSEHCEHWKS